MLVDNWRNLPQLTTYEGTQNSKQTHNSDRSARAVINYKRYGKQLGIEAMISGTLEGNKFLQQNLVGSDYVPYINSNSTGRTLQGSVNLTFNYLRNHIFTTQTTASIQNASSDESVRGTGFNKTRADFSQNLNWSAEWSEQIGRAHV